jgi:hypothetical protein
MTILWLVGEQKTSVFAPTRFGVDDFGGLSSGSHAGSLALDIQGQR